MTSKLSVAHIFGKIWSKNKNSAAFAICAGLLIAQSVSVLPVYSAPTHTSTTMGSALPTSPVVPTMKTPTAPAANSILTPSVLSNLHNVALPKPSALNGALFKNGVDSIAGNFINPGNLSIFSSSSSLKTFELLVTGSVYNPPGATITTTGGLNLEIVSQSGVYNAGSIISSGTLSVTAPTVANISPASAGNSGSSSSALMLANNGNLSITTNTLLNQGLISSTGNINIAPIAKSSSLAINSVGGTFSANSGKGVINIGGQSSSNLNIQILGGDYYCQTLNLTAGNSGSIVMQADSISGMVNTVASTCSLTTTSTASLNIGTTVGDPDYYSPGNLYINSSIIVGPNNPDGDYITLQGGNDVDIAANLVLKADGEVLVISGSQATWCAGCLNTPGSINAAGVTFESTENLINLAANGGSINAPGSTFLADSSYLLSGGPSTIPYTIFLAAQNNITVGNVSAPSGNVVVYSGSLNNNNVWYANAFPGNISIGTVKANAIIDLNSNGTYLGKDVHGQGTILIGSSSTLISGAISNKTPNGGIIAVSSAGDIHINGAITDNTNGGSTEVASAISIAMGNASEISPGNAGGFIDIACSSPSGTTPSGIPSLSLGNLSSSCPGGNGGGVTVSSGSSSTLDASGFNISVTAGGNGGSASVSNVGPLTYEGGIKTTAGLNGASINLYSSTALTVSANSVNASAGNGNGGNITLSSGGAVTDSANLVANGAGAGTSGGTITVSGGSFNSGGVSIAGNITANSTSGTGGTINATANLGSLLLNGKISATGGVSGGTTNITANDGFTNNGTIDVSGVGTGIGGTINLTSSSGLVLSGGKLIADAGANGASAGTINITGSSSTASGSPGFPAIIINGGSFTANAANGVGGAINITETLYNSAQINAGTFTANGGMGGGTITVSTQDGITIGSGATITSNGTGSASNGGTISIVDASGGGGGGGGGSPPPPPPMGPGGPVVVNSNLSANAGATGAGGTIIISTMGSNAVTIGVAAAVNITAKGGSTSGNGGTITVTSPESLTVGAGSSINASAVANGAGGNIILKVAGFGDLSVSGNVRADAGTNGLGGTVQLTSATGDIVIQSTGSEIITARGGTASGNGNLVSISSTSGTISLDGNSIDVSAPSNGIGGTLQVNGDIEDGKLEQFKATGTSGGQIVFQASGATDLIDSSLFNVKEYGVNGTGGTIKITSTAKLLTIASTTTMSVNAAPDTDGTGGNITISGCQSCTISSSAPLFSANGEGSGKGGTISINSGILQFPSPVKFTANGGQTGAGGSIIIMSASSFTLGVDRDSKIETLGGVNGGNGGNITLESGANLTLQTSEIDASARGGNFAGGVILIAAGVNKTGQLTVSSGINANSTGSASQNSQISILFNDPINGSNILAIGGATSQIDGSSIAGPINANCSGVGAPGNISISNTSGKDLAIQLVDFNISTTNAIGALGTIVLNNTAGDLKVYGSTQIIGSIQAQAKNINFNLTNTDKKYVLNLSQVQATQNTLFLSANNITTSSVSSYGNITIDTSVLTTEANISLLGTSGGISVNALKDTLKIVGGLGCIFNATNTDEQGDTSFTAPKSIEFDNYLQFSMGENQPLSFTTTNNASRITFNTIVEVNNAPILNITTNNLTFAPGVAFIALDQQPLSVTITNPGRGLTIGGGTQSGSAAVGFSLPPYSDITINGIGDVTFTGASQIQLYTGLVANSLPGVTVTSTGSIVVGADVSLVGVGNFSWQANSYRIEGPVVTSGFDFEFELNGGTMVLGANVAAGGTMEFNGSGNIVQQSGMLGGTIGLPPTGVFDSLLRVTFTGALNVGNATQPIVLAGVSSVGFTTNSMFIEQSGGGINIINNQGQPSSASRDISITASNFIDIQQKLMSGSTLTLDSTSGDIVIESSNGTLQLDSPHVVLLNSAGGNISLNSSTVFSGSVDIEATGSNATISLPNDLTFNSGDLFVQAGTISISGNLTGRNSSFQTNTFFDNGSITSSQKFSIFGSPSLYLTGSAQPITAGNSISVESSAALEFDSNYSFAINGASTTTGELINISAGGTLALDPGITITLGANTKVTAGTLSLGNGSMFTLSNPSASINVDPEVILPAGGTASIITNGGAINFIQKPGSELRFSSAGNNPAILNMMGGPVTLQATGANIEIDSGVTLNSADHVSLLSKSGRDIVKGRINSSGITEVESPEPVSLRNLELNPQFVSPISNIEDSHSVVTNRVATIASLPSPPGTAQRKNTALSYFVQPCLEQVADKSSAISKAATREVSKSRKRTTALASFSHGQNRMIISDDETLVFGVGVEGGTVNTELGELMVPKGAIVLIDKSKQQTSVYNLSDSPGYTPSVISTDGNEMTLPVGSCLARISGNEKVAIRKSSVRWLCGSLRIAEFSYVSLLAQSSILNTLATSNENKVSFAQILKMAAIFQSMSQLKEPFSF